MTNNDLAEQIEHLIRQHVDALRTIAATAVTRGFAAAQPHVPARASGPTQAVRPRKPAAARRSPDELIALGERFYAVLCRQPGETMTTLASQVGVAPQVLHVAVARLRRAGRVRTVGQRQHTRYFPMTASTTAPAPLAAAA